MWRSRVVTYRERGSVRFTRAERESYALLLDVEILSLVSRPYENLKSNPTESFYGKGTTFHGSMPFALDNMIFPKQRFLNLRNENAARALDDAIERINANIFGNNLGEAIQNFENVRQAGLLAPVLEHRETIFKFVANPLTQFQVTVWRLAFSEDDLVEPDFSDPDPTRNDSQYPEPRVNPIDMPYLGNPEESPRPERLDPRDFAPPEDGNSAVIGTGVTQFEFATADNPTFQPGGGGTLNYPGFLSSRDLTDGRLTIDWVDADGQRSAITVTDSDSISVRAYGMVLSDGSVYRPLADSFTNDR